MGSKSKQNPHVKQIDRSGRKVWIIDRVFKRLSDGVKERYRRDAEVQTSAAAHAEYDRIVAHWLANGSVTALLKAPKVEPKIEAPKVPTWNDALKWYRETIAPRLKPATRDGYAALWDGPHFKRWDGIEITEANVNIATCEAWSTEIAAAGNGDSSIRNAHIAFRSVIRKAHAAKVVTYMPTFPKLPKLGKKVGAAPDDEHVTAILTEEIPAHWGPRGVRRRLARLAFNIAIHAGLRSSEIRALRHTDIDRKRRILKVRQASYRGQVDTPKSGHEREIPINDALWAELTSHEVEARRKKDPFGLVVPKADGTPWGDTGLLQALRRATNRLGLPKSKVHGLRHYFVTRLFEVGVDAPAVRDLAGHGSLAVTERYAHSRKARLREAVLRLDAPRGNGVAMATGTA